MGRGLVHEPVECGAKQRKDSRRLLLQSVPCQTTQRGQEGSRNCALGNLQLLQEKSESRYNEPKSHQSKTGADPCQNVRSAAR